MAHPLQIMRHFWWAVAAAIACAAALAWLLWPRPGLPGGAAPTRQYLNFDACLLTDAHGVAGHTAAVVWSGMQRSSLATRARVSYLPVFGAGTETDARPYLASLLQRHCEIVLAVGPAQVAAVTADAAHFPRVRFVAIGAAVRGTHVTEIATGSDAHIRAAVSRAVTDAVNQSASD